MEKGLKYIEDNEPITKLVSGFIMRGMNGLEFLKRVCRIHCIKDLMNYQNHHWNETKKCFEKSFDILTRRWPLKSLPEAMRQLHP